MYYLGEVKIKPSNKRNIIILKDHSKPVTSYDPEGTGEVDDNQQEPPNLDSWDHQSLVTTALPSNGHSHLTFRLEDFSFWKMSIEQKQKSLILLKEKCKSHKPRQLSNDKSQKLKREREVRGGMVLTIPHEFVPRNVVKQGNGSVWMFEMKSSIFLIKMIK